MNSNARNSSPSSPPHPLHIPLHRPKFRPLDRPHHLPHTGLTQLLLGPPGPLVPIQLGPYMPIPRPPLISGPPPELVLPVCACSPVYMGHDLISRPPFEPGPTPSGDEEEDGEDGEGYETAG
ncbi:hypothetical protein TruAng_007209 [Truncatella angustata]|nr:hypothetical protein TruAng_007209 [Truncatella angustata]